MSVNIAVVGATGMVGRKMLKVLEERQLPVDQYYLFASARSAGKTMTFMGREYTVEELTPTCMDGKKIDYAVFSAGAGTSRTYAPIFASKGIIVVDNSSCWRMDPEIPLVVPEVNPEALEGQTRNIIANPNCSTIQAVVALKPLHDAYGIKRIVYSTYQAVSGAGMGGYNDLKNGMNGEPPKKFNKPIFGNCLPQIDVFEEDGYTKEEMKMINETRKILGEPDMRITATTVRVPVFHSHSESINVEFEKEFDLDELREVLRKAPGVIVQDDFKNEEYPMAILAEDTDPVYVGRIRRDNSVESGVNLWVVADNIRKGAATNTIQIVEELMRQKHQL
ncbi:MAG: aspartate-semialdehyde dehydrogenase [Clostridia bacterium]|nr:aspartate-semialdehyde dehydrogenase [Clostridia bacterium]